MSNFWESFYAMNKGKRGVVYPLDKNTYLEITFEICKKDDPNITFEKFNEIKEYSDEQYKEQLNGDNREHYYSPISLDLNIDSDWMATLSLEDEYFSEDKEPIPTIEEVKAAAKKILTKKQKRRFYMFLNGLNTIKIAEIEDCTQNAVWESLQYSFKKIKKFFSKNTGKR